MTKHRVLALHLDPCLSFSPVVILAIAVLCSVDAIRLEQLLGQAARDVDIAQHFCKGRQPSKTYASMGAVTPMASRFVSPVSRLCYS